MLAARAGRAKRGARELEVAGAGDQRLAAAHDVLGEQPLLVAAEGREANTRLTVPRRARRARSSGPACAWLGRAAPPASATAMPTSCQAFQLIGDSVRVPSSRRLVCAAAKASRNALAAV